MTPSAIPNLKAERELFDGGAPVVLACDEVGRGALAGPVAVGLVLIDASVRRMPAGLRDSKLMTEPRREAMAPRAAAWVRGWAVGEASAAEIDELGIMACLGLAGARAYAALTAAQEVALDAPLLLDGNYDWLSASIERRARVTTRIKADRDCASVAAASVIAKVHRDRRDAGLARGLPRVRLGREQGVLEPRPLRGPRRARSQRAAPAHVAARAPRGGADALRPRRRMSPDG